MAQAKKVNRKPVHRRALRGVHLALVPHRHNDYHPHLIRHYGLAVILLLVVALQAFHFTFENNQILGDQSDITTTQLLNQTNSQRADNALAALRLNDKLSLAAQEKAQDMLDRGYWSHDAPDGTPPWRWITDNDYKYVDAGENLARGFNTTDGITRAWMESPTHRANILDANYTEVGFAALSGEMNGQATTLVVAMYARPVGVPNTGDTVGEKVGVTENADDLWTRLRRGISSLTPSLIVTLVLLGIVTCVALLAHAFRRNLPKSWQKSWKRHHALYKVGLVVFIALCAVLSYGGGMI